MPGPILIPQVIVEVAFSAGASTQTYLHLDDPTRGRLDTGTLAPDAIWTDVSEWVLSVETRRGSNRVTDPVVRYEAGTATIVFDNSDRRFDPTNLAGPYVVAGATQVTPMRAVRIRAIWGNVTYDLFRGFADEWRINYADPSWSEVVLTASDAFKVFGNIDRLAGASVGASEDSGARVNRILDAIGWPATDRQVAVGNSTLQATTLAANMLTELQLTEDSELGEFYIDGAGRVVFRNRQGLLADSRSVNAQGAFGSNYVSRVQAAAPIGYWHLDETSGTTVADSSGHGLAGTVQGAVRLGAPGVLADTATAFEFTNSPYVLVADNALLHPSAVSVEAWFYKTADASFQRIVSGGAFPNNNWQLYADNTGGLFFSVVDSVGSYHSVVSGLVIPLNTWAHAVGTWDGTTIKLYVNGVLRQSVPGSITMLTGSGGMGIGGDANGGNPWNGRIDEAALYNYALSAAQVADHYYADALPYERVEVAYDDAPLANRARISRTGGVEQQADDAASQSLYLIRTHKRDGLLMETDAAAKDYAGFIVHVASQPELRFASMTLFPRETESDSVLDLMTQVLSREIGDRITITRRPPGGGSPITRDAFIRGITHDVQQVHTWRTTWVLQSATRYSFLVLDHPVLGTLDNNALGY